MSNFKDFYAMLAEKAGDRPSFKLCGQEFTCKKKLPWRAWNAMILSLQFENDTTDEMVEKFFNMVLTTSDKEKFFELLDKDDVDEEGNEIEDDNFVSDEQTGAVMKWLLDLYTGKAQENDESSSGKQPTSGQPAKVVSLSRRKG